MCSWREGGLIPREWTVSVKTHLLDATMRIGVMANVTRLTIMQLVIMMVEIAARKTQQIIVKIKYEMLFDVN